MGRTLTGFKATGIASGCSAAWQRATFGTLMEVQVLVEQYRQLYNRIRPHSSLGYRPPAPQAILPAGPAKVLVGLT